MFIRQERQGLRLTTLFTVENNLRFGTAITRREGELRLNTARFKNDLRPIDADCQCRTCRGGYSRAFLNATIGKVTFQVISFLKLISQETIACHLISIHNIHHHLDLMRRLRKAIQQGQLNEFLSGFLKEQFGDAQKVPNWVREAIQYAGYEWHF